MKHTLKSLLIITVLTLPTVFGAELPLDDDNSTSTALQQQDLKEAATARTTSTSTFDRLPIYVLKYIFGSFFADYEYGVYFADTSIHSPGYLDHRTLTVLARTSKKIMKFLFQTMFCPAMEWAQSGVMERILTSTLSEMDLSMLNHYDYDVSDMFKCLMAILNDGEISYKPLRITKGIKTQTHLNDAEKYQLRSLLISSGPRNILDGFEKLLSNGFRPRKGVINLIYHGAPYGIDDSNFFTEIATLLSDTNLAPLILDISLELVRNEKISRSALSDMIVHLQKKDEDSLSYRNKQYKLLTMIANHPNADRYIIAKTASKLKYLGNKELARQILLSKSQSDNLQLVYICADMLESLGEREEARRLFAKVMVSESLEGLIDEFQHGYLSGIRKEVYPEIGRQRIEGLLSAPNVRIDDIFIAAKFKDQMGDYEEALTLYRTVQADPNVQSYQAKVSPYEVELAIASLQKKIESRTTNPKFKPSLV